MLIEKLPFLLVNTLLFYIPLLALNDGQTDRMTEDELILVGLGNYHSSRLILVGMGSLTRFLQVNPGWAG